MSYCLYLCLSVWCVCVCTSVCLSACLCLQVSWQWRSLVDSDELWIVLCQRLGWTLTHSMSPFDKSAWKRLYIENIISLKRTVTPVVGRIIIRGCRMGFAWHLSLLFSKRGKQYVFLGHIPVHLIKRTITSLWLSPLMVLTTMNVPSLQPWTWTTHHGRFVIIPSPWIWKLLGLINVIGHLESYKPFFFFSYACHLP